MQVSGLLAQSSSRELERENVALVLKMPEIRVQRREVSRSTKEELLAV
jgi:hypothetical protein